MLRICAFTGDKGRHFDITLTGNTIGTTREERAALRRDTHVGRRPFDLDQALTTLPHVVAWQRLEETERIWMAGVLEDIDDRTALDNHAAVHDLYGVSQTGNY